MTLHQSVRPAPSDHTAPFLPEDKARARELFEQVKDTDREQSYRDISLRHPDKEANRATYRAFLDDIEALFVDPQAEQASVPAFDPHELRPPMAETGAGEEHDEAVEPSELDIEHGDLEATNNAEVETDEPAPSESLPPSARTEQTAILPLAGSGLISQLAGMLAEGGQLSFTMLRLGDEVTLGISPKPHGTESVVPLLLTGTPAYLDEHLVSAMQPYVEVRRDIYAQCTSAAKAQRKAGEKAASTPASTKTASSKPSATVPLTLAGMEGTTLTATSSGKSVDVALGTQAMPKGTLTINARHAVYGDHGKTLLMSEGRTYDFREQQGAAITLQVTLDSAAITAVQGDKRVALHSGDGFLAPGKWVIEAEADGHTKQSKPITVVAAKLQTVILTLPEEREQSLF